LSSLNISDAGATDSFVHLVMPCALDGGSLDEDPHGKPGSTSQATTHCVRLGADYICRS
jgi:hypothetical protein